MGLLSSSVKIFKPSKDDVNKVLDTIDPPITEESCCVNGQCTCGAAETADELVSDMLHASTIAAQKERQKEEQNHEEPKHDFESIRNETQPGRRTNTVLQDGDGSGPIKCGGVHYATDNEGPKARTKTKSTRKKGTRKSRKK